MSGYPQQQPVHGLDPAAYDRKIFPSAIRIHCGKNPVGKKIGQSGGWFFNRRSRITGCAIIHAAGHANGIPLPGGRIIIRVYARGSGDSQLKSVFRIIKQPGHIRLIPYMADFGRSCIGMAGEHAFFKGKISQDNGSGIYTILFTGNQNRVMKSMPVVIRSLFQHLPAEFQAIIQFVKFRFSGKPHHDRKLSKKKVCRIVVGPYHMGFQRYKRIAGGSPGICSILIFCDYSVNNLPLKIFCIRSIR